MSQPKAVWSKIKGKNEPSIRDVQRIVEGKANIYYFVMACASCIFWASKV